MATSAPVGVGVEIDHVSHVFDELLVLTDVSVRVPPHTFVSIVGPSGCGKTTLLRIIDGLITPTAGEVRIGGQPVRGPGRDRAMVFQDADLLPWRTALHNVSFGQEVQGVGKQQRLDNARAAMGRVGLEGFEHHYPFQLSGGMRQRVGLARALSTGPRLLLMDEPFGALDAQTRTLMQEELIKIARRNPRTVLFITHAVEEAVYLADRVVVMTRRPGRLAEIVDVAPVRRAGGWETLNRVEEVMERSSFVELKSRIWRLLRDQQANPERKEHV
jgi:NitT/TauT family transport system ATP-binding protein